MTVILSDQEIENAVQRWIGSVVVDLNLCPFARRELEEGRVRFIVTDVTREEGLLAVLQAELNLLATDAAIETTVLIHPAVLQDFFDYNAFLDYADNLLSELSFEGVFQVASFHPDYQFAGTQADDAENYTNRSPYPLLHLLREDSMERAIAGHPDVGQIPIRNVELMKALGQRKLELLVRDCFSNGSRQ